MSIMPLLMLRRNQAETLLDVDFNSSMTALPASLTGVGATFTRASTRYRRVGNILVSQPVNGFFTELDSTTGKYGYTPEPARTNQMRRSVDHNGVFWSFNSMNFGYDAGTDPFGTGGADYANNLAGNGGTAMVQNSTSTPSGNTLPYTLSVYFKYTGLAGFGLTPWPYWAFGFFNGVGTLLSVQWVNTQTMTVGSNTTANGATFISNKVERLGTGDWYRFSLTFIPSVTSGLVRLYCVGADGSLTSLLGQKNIFVWGWQMEQGYEATSFIPTIDSTVTRAADILSVATSGIPYANPYKAVLLANFRKKAVIPETYDLLSINDGSGTNQVTLRLSDADKATLRINSTDIVGATNLGTTEHKFAASVQGFNKLRSLDGNTLIADTTASIPAAISSLNIGHSLAVRQTAAYIYGIKYITNVRSQAQLNALTT